MNSAKHSAIVESIVASLIASRRSSTRFAEPPRLHHAGMQIEIVRHHRRAEDAEREIEHVGIA